MSEWVLKGFQTGIVTTQYPDKEETSPGISPGLPEGGEGRKEASSLLSCCPVNALGEEDGRLIVDHGRCIHCFRCVRGPAESLEIKAGYEWARQLTETFRLDRAFCLSLNIRVVDAGACSACLSEIEQVNKPYYNMHRLGFFLTPTPRNADVLMIAGPVTEHMRMPLKKVYDAMPSPKGVIAIGACALSGGIFGPSFASGSGILGFIPGDRDMIPVDVGVPGCPPPPLAIIHGLLVMTGRRPSSSVISLTAHDGGGNNV